MHADEVDVDVHLVRSLVAAQFPEWSRLPVEPVLPRETDNALYRLIHRQASTTRPGGAPSAWALSQALTALSYYTLDTNAALVREAEHWLSEVLGV